MDLGAYILTALLAYLAGSIPTGFLFGKARGIDIRTVGSGNIGATNVFRFLGKKAGVAVLLLDGLKGFAACEWIRFPSADPELSAIVAGISAILGHNFTIWLRFKGGKGIATSAGVLIALIPSALLVVLGVWILVFLTSRYVSLASVAAAFVLPFAVFFLTSSIKLTLVGVALGALAIYKHRANIQRLRAGTENRFHFKGQTK